MPLESKLSFEEIRNMYNTKRERKTFSLMLMGEFSSGKTSLICTMPKPIWIASFDPHGTIVIEKNYPEEIERGDIIISTYWSDDFNKPVAYKKWAKDWDDAVKGRLFDKIGTYAIDSASTWIDALSNKVAQFNKLS